MKEIAEATRRLRDATDLPAILSAAHAAFGTLLALIEDLQGRADGAISEVIMAGNAAANGSLAILAAPSLPRQRARVSRPVAAGKAAGAGAGPPAMSREETEAAVTELGELLASRLNEAMPLAKGPADRVACAEASRHARAVSSRLGGSD